MLSRKPGPELSLQSRVPLDKNEGGVKDKLVLSVFLPPLFAARERLRTKTLEISR
jgi:hypothetical protein